MGRCFLPSVDAHRRIEQHGVIGNLSTIALVAIDATIDYLCWPKLDSPSLFAALLDTVHGGAFRLAPDLTEAETRQIYLPDSNVLLTRWLAPEASVEVLDLMVVSDGLDPDPPRLVRRIRATRGTVRMRLACAPRYGYGLREATVTKMENGVRFSGNAGDPALRLIGTHALDAGAGEATAEFSLSTGEQADFLLEADEPVAEGGNALPLAALDRAIEATIAYWQRWAARSDYRGRWRNEMNRSALVLKLLTSREHGSIAAAATFGLPEQPGGTLNWDYRATWLRDASFSVYAFMRLGHTAEAIHFMRWVGARANGCDDDGSLRIMYRLDGGSDLQERALDHLAGYRGARPVRIGNLAAEQIQLDIYGELLDSVYLNAKYGEPPGYDAWRRISRSVEYVCQHWREPDAGIWEVRGEPRHFLHSRLMCWVAVDRAIRMASKRSLPAPYGRWSETRNEIHDSIWAKFWSESCGHFVQTPDSREVDGALLLMPLVRFVTGNDPRWLATLDAITRTLTADGLVFRTPAGRAGREGAFAACSFWYVECLARAGRLTEAQATLERTLSYANHVGLYAEEFDVQAHQLGNFPQALTHLALISAVYYVDRACSR
ncbi:glycoside hydrolase family 15 protein [Rhodopila sp.]|uniref:glycoside hydrolase family 15 protein n=1 Tax=Rhodopila sp. TaxID=2480087 RepID=UPI003D0DCB65